MHLKQNEQLALNQEITEPLAVLKPDKDFRICYCLMLVLKSIIIWQMCKVHFHQVMLYLCGPEAMTFFTELLIQTR